MSRNCSISPKTNKNFVYQINSFSSNRFFVYLFPWASVYCGLTGLLYRTLWTFQPWPPDALAPTYAFRTPATEFGTYGRRRTGKFSLNADFHGTFRDILHSANLRHGTHVLKIFPPLKIRRLRPGLNPRTWVPEASTLTPRPPKPLSSNRALHLNLWP
jgi:hypothetical protein